jgi:hypothetical protein
LVMRFVQNGRQRTGLCDVGEFEKRLPETEAQLKN